MQKKGVRNRAAMFRSNDRCSKEFFAFPSNKVLLLKVKKCGTYIVCNVCAVFLPTTLHGTKFKTDYIFF
jgi:hypothetical protein